jgi:hypothetical protein
LGRLKRETSVGFEKILEDFERKIAKRHIGSQQDTVGKIRSRFSEKFLGHFDRDHRDQLESLIKDTYQYDDFRRFRSHMVLALALSYNNGAIAAEKGKRVDVLKLIKEAGKEIMEEATARIQSSD